MSNFLSETCCCDGTYLKKDQRVDCGRVDPKRWLNKLRKKMRFWVREIVEITFEKISVSLIVDRES